MLKKDIKNHPNLNSFLEEIGFVKIKEDTFKFQA